jgi:hypothetical protein
MFPAYSWLWKVICACVCKEKIIQLFGPVHHYGFSYFFMLPCITAFKQRCLIMPSNSGNLHIAESIALCNKSNCILTSVGDQKIFIVQAVQLKKLGR